MMASADHLIQLRVMAGELLEKLAPMMMYDVWEQMCEQALYKVDDKMNLHDKTAEEQAAYWENMIRILKAAIQERRL